MSCFKAVRLTYGACRIYKESDSSLYSDFDYILQPIINPLTGRAHSYEVLSRVLSSSGECYDSEDFFSSIDDEFIKSIVLNQLETLQKASEVRGVIFSYNMPLSVLEDYDFVCQIIEYAITPIAIEVNDLSADFESARLHNHIQLLRSAGHKIWLDDFNHKDLTFFRSLTQFSWDLIKIDRAYLFNHDLFENLESLIRFLKYYTKEIVVEGVESDYYLSFLSRKKVLAQGFYFSPGLTPDELLPRVCDTSLH
ncbi:EAL domain-containing protein [Photobacterium atrarenae]|uniref:EAL domain-containing protein n=1 Tax=Photobacterium atrarenae TaxID=865757 RepID=A0ABY5GQU7_9GAMM|nr:EAL domain-containing protein [Photobacterium atrarenae]UTV31029.1 EAL domain-containing protein [Photobacterium atrarenae]